MNDSRYWKTVEIPPIDELCESLKIKFKDVYEENARLKEENTKLKNGEWAKEEISRLKEDYNRMRADWLRGFPISEEESQNIDKWMKAHKSPGYTYTFVPTSIGVSGKISDGRGNVLEFKEIG